MTSSGREELVRLSGRLLGRALEPGWRGLDPVLPLLERMRADGAVVVVKLDGQRSWDPCSVIVSGGPLGDAYFRADHGSLEETVARVIVAYARRCWLPTEDRAR